MTMVYKLGKHSLGELEGVHPDLELVIRCAIRVTSQDFTVVDGSRTKEQQAEYVRKGVSQTMNSLHLPQADGWAHAVDLVPWISGQLRWELEPLYNIARAVQTVADLIKVPLLWGGSWEPLLGDPRDVKLRVEDYTARRRAEGRTPFVDAPHFQLDPSHYR